MKKPDTFKMLFISIAFPPRVGGAEKFHEKLARHFGSRLVVIARKVKEKTSDCDRGLTVYRKKFFFKEPNNPLGKYLAVFFQRLHILAISLWIIAKHRVKLIVFGDLLFPWLGYVLNRLFGLKYFFLLHGTELCKLKNRDCFLLSKYKRYFNRAEKIIVNSNFTFQLALDCGIKEGKLEIVFPGCDNPIQTDSLPAKEKLNGKGPILLGVGRLVKRKGFDSVIRALPLVLNKYPELKYYIVGDGYQKDYLEQLAKNNRVDANVVFKGKTDEYELNELYRACDVFILTNYIDEENYQVEGFGMVFAEANSFSKPVIGGNNGGAKEAIIDGITGLLVDPKNEKEIAEKILYLLDSPEIREKMGENGRKRVEEELNWDCAFSKMEKLLNL